MKAIAIPFLLVVIHYGSYGQNMDVMKVPNPNGRGMIDCGLQGDATESKKVPWELNPQKNRYDIPEDSKIQEMDINDLLVANAKKYKVGTPVRVTGFIEKVVRKGSKESCNCHADKAAYQDTHIYLQPDDQSSGPESRMIIEVTPRLRKIMHEQGEDWTTLQLAKDYEGQKVTVEGWLFYDKEHEKDAFLTNPKNKKNWRASCWEIHPITKLQLEEEEYETATPTSGPIGEDNEVAYSAPVVKPDGGSPKTVIDRTPAQILSLVILGALLGMVGQGVRVAVGLKKLQDSSESKEHYESQFDGKKLTLSIAYAALIGLVSGVLMVVNGMDTLDLNNKASILAIIAAGYSGVDFIEGLMGKSLPSSSSSKKGKAGTSAPPQGAIDQV